MAKDRRWPWTTFERLIHINASVVILVRLTGVMRNLIILALGGLVFSSPARAEVLYVRPDNGSPTAEYRWHDEVIRDSISVNAAITLVKTDP
jgi:hypothetical protein